MPLKTHLDEQPQMNMTPMIDCVFLLLIFFLAASRLDEAQEKRIALRLPEVVDRGALTAAPAKKVVSVYRDGSITLDGSPIGIRELTAQLAAARSQYADLGVLVRGDAQGQYEHVAQVLNACKQAGIRQLGISVRTIRPGE